MRTTSKRRSGMTRSERATMDDLARAVVMRRFGAVPVDSDTGPFRWWGRCQWCENLHLVEWSHIHGKGAFPASRWDADNALGLCSHCHGWSHGHGAAAFRDFISFRMGEERAQALAARVRRTVKVCVSAQRAALEFELGQLMEGGAQA